ncbi:glycosyl transferase family 1 [Halobacteriales archaeon QS_1_68_17]|nr:MAG: glycosyl transferase family 1 [Halobacteriales archaeon QS_1_68_17]
MRVAFVVMETSHHQDMDGRRRLERIAAQLAGRGHDVTVYCAQWWDGYEQTRERDGVTYRGVTVSPALTSFTVRLPVLLALDRPDVVHAAMSPPSAVVAAGVGGTLARAPLVAEWFGDTDLPATRTRRWAVRRPATIVTPSELVRTRIREAGADERDTRVIPEGVDTSLIRETEPGESADVVYARHLDADANVEELLLALAELRDRQWAATIIGDGPERAGYERQAADLRIDDRVTFAGELPRAERVARYRGAHTFVQTARREQFATELLWALACGCVGIVEYQADSSAHGLIETYERSFRVTDPEELAEAIVSAGEYERADVDESLDEYDHEAILERYLECYRDLQSEFGLL